jgi:hypothetical protein
MSATPAGEDLVARLQLALSGLRAEAAAAAAALGESGSASDPYAAVQVARDGRLVDIVFTDRILTATPPIVGGSVMTLYGQARTAVQHGRADAIIPDTVAAAPAEPTPRLPGGDDFFAALRRADGTGTDALLAASPFPRLEVGPGFDDLMRARLTARAVAVTEAQAELARVRTSARSATVEVEVDAAGALLAVRIRSGGPRSGPAALRASLLETLAEAFAAARTESGRILAEHGLPDSGRF